MRSGLRPSRNASAALLALCVALACAGAVGCGNEPVAEDQIGRTNWGTGGTNAANPLEDDTGGTWVPVEPDELQLMVDTGEAQLGGYELTLVFDPNAIEMATIVSANELFPVLYDKTQFLTGRVRLAGMHANSYGPSGRFVLARVQFRVLRASTTLSMVDLVRVEQVPEPRAYTPVPEPRNVLAGFVLVPSN